MDIENIKKVMFDYFENRPSKEVFEKFLIEIIMEKNKIILNEDNKNLINEMDKLIENVQEYLIITSK
jgi:hypothetical protein